MKPNPLALLALFVFAWIAGLATMARAQTLTTGTIAGTVTDAAGAGLPGVQIRIVDAGQTDVTDANGRFTISGVLPGEHTVEASLVGYQPVVASGAVVTQELATTVHLILSEKIETSLGATTVVAPMVRKDVTPTLYVVTSRDEQLVRSQPNYLHQYTGAIVSQPGVVPDAGGYPTIRGSRRNDVGYMLDGILIVESSTGGFATNLVTVGMDRMNLYTGGYRAELGSASGGIINAVLKSGASMRGSAIVETAVGSWDYTGLVYEQGDVEENGFSWFVAGNLFRTGFEKDRRVDELPVSANAVVKLIQPIGERNRLSLLYTGGFVRYEFPEIDPFTGEPWGGSERANHDVTFDYNSNAWAFGDPQQDHQTQSHHIGSLTWSHQFNNTSSLAAQVYTWDRRLDNHEFSKWSGFEYRGRDRLYAGNLHYSTQLAPRLHLRIGGETIRGENYNSSVQNSFGRLPRSAGGTGTDLIQRRVQDTDTLDRNAYLSTTWKPTDRLTADIGLRYDSREYNRPAALLAAVAAGSAATRAADEAALAETGMNPRYSGVSPRLGLAYSLSPRTVLKASAGRFTQFAPARYLDQYTIPVQNPWQGSNKYESEFWLRNNRKVFDVGPQKVDGVEFGVETQLVGNLALAVTPYWRRTKDMVDFGPVIRDDGSTLPGGGAFGNWARGKASGVETSLRMRERGGLGGWISYTYQNARANTTAPLPGGGLVDPTRPDRLHRLNYDQRHTLYLVGQYRRGRYEVNPMLELGSGYPFGTGRQYWQSLPILVDGRVASKEINSYNTGWHDNLSVTFRLFTDTRRSSYYFLQIQNVLSSGDTMARNWFDPTTGSPAFGFVDKEVTYTDEDGSTATAPGYYEYKTTTRVPPIFVLLGLRRTF